MGEPKWTPGPWIANLHHTKKRGGLNHGFIHAGAVVPLAAVVLGVEGVPETEGRANAHLLAAAPDLYAALAAVSDMLFRRPDMVAVLPKMMGPAENAVFEAAGAALAKARGE